MDLETENRLAALLMEEARRLRAQAEREGVGVYLRQPNVRGRPNSRFLTATVLGVEQANRAVEVNEMWRAREKERELDAKLKSREKDKELRYGDKNPGDPRKKVSSSRHEEAVCGRSAYASSSKHGHDDDTCYTSDDGGLKDDEVEDFLRSRAKRGRGAIGSRMDEPGPYPLATSSDHGTGKLLADPDAREKEDWEHRIRGPEKSSFIKSHELPPEEVRDADSSKKKHRSKEKKRRRSKEERSERKKNKEKKKHKHRHHKRSRRSGSDSEYIDKLS